MAYRDIKLEGDPILYKKCRPVTEFNDRIKLLLDDMKETLTRANGVGLAAPQVGILRRAVVIEVEDPDADDSTEEKPKKIMEFINPTILSTEGEQTGLEGCLSIPGWYGVVTRPMKVRVKAQDRDGNWFEYEGEALTARCICHELDHLEGHLFREKSKKMYSEEQISNGEADEED
jgi:peptide deformylase